jgi:hypothetical protein
MYVCTNPKFRSTLYQLYVRHNPPLKLFGSKFDELTESAFDRSSQRSSGSSTMLSAQFRRLRWEVLEAEQDAVASEDWESVDADIEPVD